MSDANWAVDGATNYLMWMHVCSAVETVACLRAETKDCPACGCVRPASVNAFKTWRNQVREMNRQEFEGKWPSPEQPTCQDQFNLLRVQVKLSPAQAHEMKHLEAHLDAGDVVCNCKDEKRRLE